MKTSFVFLLIFILDIFCTKNPVKTKKWYIDGLFTIIHNEIDKQYTEKTTVYDKICSHEFLLLENRPYFNTEATDEIFKFLRAKKPEEFHIILSFVKTNEIFDGFRYNVSMAVIKNFYFGLKLAGLYYEFPVTSICAKNYSNYVNPYIREYILERFIAKFIFHHLNIFKRIITKIVSDRKKVFFIPIFSDMIFFEKSDHDFITRLLLKQKYKYENDYYLLINDLKINDQYDEKVKIKNILEYSFTNAIFESIRNISFKRIGISNKSLKEQLYINHKNKIVSKEVYLYGRNTYLNIYDIFLSNFQNDIEMEDKMTGNMEVFGYGSANIDIITFIKADKQKKAKKSLEETCCLTIRNREINMEYNFYFLYKPFNNELIDISVDQNIPGFSSDMALKDKISFILKFVKEYETCNFKLVVWIQTESIVFQKK